MGDDERIIVTYENEKNGQKMKIVLTPEPEEDNLKINIDFEPDLKDETIDHYGVLRKMYDVFLQI